MNTRPSSPTSDVVEAAERAVRITVWNFLRERGVKDDDCYPIIEGIAQPSGQTASPNTSDNREIE